MYEKKKNRVKILIVVIIILIIFVVGVEILYNSIIDECCHCECTDDICPAVCCDCNYNTFEKIERLIEYFK